MKQYIPNSTTFYHKDVTEQQLITACREGNRKAQRLLYEQYAAKMFGVCRRYIQNEHDIEDTLLKSFCKVFKSLHQFSNKGSFEGWIRRIVVNEALGFIRKKNTNKHLFTVELDDSHNLSTTYNASDNIHTTDILKLLDLLPTGYRTVFNLYAIEGYSHKEIAAQLAVSINTSKSQLLKARRMLQHLLNDAKYKQTST